MKNRFFTLFLACVFVFTLSVNVIAEGEIPIGGRNCQPPAPTCLVNDQQPETPKEEENDKTIVDSVLEYLAELFG